jgi:hypothetical protein
MAASPDLSRLPPRGPGDLGTLDNTSQDRQLEKQLSFFTFSTTNGCKKHLDALLVMYSKLYYIVKLYYKSNKKILGLLSWWSGGVPTPCRSGTVSDAGHHHVCRLLYSFLCGGHRRLDGTNQDESQLEGRVVAPDAGEDILCRPPGNCSPFCLQEVVHARL